MKTGRWLIAWSVCAGLLSARGGSPTSCTLCHGDLEWIENPVWVQMVKDFTNDVHFSVDVSCHDCHGGNPDPALAEDPFAAMDPDYQPNPYRGELARTDIPEFCGRCHSDAQYMKGFNPDLRVDQLDEYWTSRHGQLLKAGDTNVATCVECHGTHTIRAPGDPQSRVYPKTVAETCSSCHSDPVRMAGYTTAHGSPLPVNQYEKWRRSVHAAAMFAKDDLSAPTCNDCHGNHGATPPQLESIAFVCGHCHGREAGLFRSSAKHAGFEEHNQSYLPDMGQGGCRECHEPPSPSANITNLTEFSECITCHGNHAVLSPSIAMLGPLLETPCAYCHEGDSPAAASLAEPEQTLRNYQREKQVLLQQAKAAGLEGDARFDWLVDQALDLPMHQSGGPGASGRGSLRPEFGRLFHKFRIGKTHFDYVDPATGETVKEKVVHCTDCHDQGSQGLEVAGGIAGGMHEVAVQTARAERTLLAAKRGGVEVRTAHLQLDKAVDSQIELQVLVHTFSTATNGLFMQKRQEGLALANEALTAGNSALGELRFRRKGLLVSLGIILCLLVGLGLKIRELSRS